MRWRGCENSWRNGPSDYATRKQQLGRPIGGFQLIQEKLERMLGSLNAALALAIRLAELSETQAGVNDEQAALAQVWVCAHM
ncbi:acyl-CoA dehydrogenase family protein [Nesterenkonia haasae]|uniref:acyl-CoA dehydrogenase family protein n=1 Tax=Nesterenkonia haasae TaxID=2587813 RepID=UPI0013917D1D|nr:acyl-CoA dehydrogenase family protein [Nesterenkonia haasae]